MASISLSLHQVTSAASVSGAAQYTVLNEVVASVGMSQAVFVYNLQSGAFDHYATAADMSLYPDDKDTAAAQGAQFYRQPSITRVWSTIDQMQDDLSITQQRLGRLVTELSDLQTSLIVDQVVTLSAGS